MRSSVDAAKTTDENKRHWANANGLGPNATFDEATRQKCRNRGRYEGLNNSYAHGLGRSMAYDLIGTGPRPQLGIPGDENGDAARIVERNYAKWARAVALGRKYRLMEKSAVFAGEVFGVLNTNLRVKNPIKLDLRLLEAEQCTSPWNLPANANVIDGILFDEQWNPVEYYFLRQHPGETSMMGYTAQDQFQTVAARNVIHWYEQDRPGQVRGIPKITSSLPNFAQLRRVRLATLTAMEFAAMLAGVMKTALPPLDGSAVTVDNWELFELVRGALLTLPAGWEATQFKPEQPTTNFEMFNREVLNECGRGVGAPLNVVTGNSSQYNFSSGRLDHVPYQAGLWIDRDDFELVCAEPVFMAWEENARAWSAANPNMPAQVDPSLPPIDEWTITWDWDGFGSIDPVKDANADDTRIKDGTEHYAGALGARGVNWRSHFEQIAQEKAYAESLGLTYPLLSNAPSAAQPAPGTMEETVAAAMEEAGVTESKAAEVLDMLSATFAQVRAKPINGHRFNGHAMAGGSN